MTVREGYFMTVREGYFMSKKLLIGVACVLIVGALSAASASAAAFPQFWTDSTKTTLLRSVTAVPKNQPDALEWVNNGPVEFVLTPSTKEAPVLCNEVEFGTTVLVNSGELETKLALPFGVAEGDDCIQDMPGGVIEVPTYFDTGANGVVPASITFTGAKPPFIATLHKLKFSLNKSRTFCTVSLEGAKGTVENVVEGFVEESPPNLNMTFPGVPTSVICGTTKLKGIFAANFFLETMSTTTDTAFLG